MQRKLRAGARERFLSSLIRKRCTQHFYVPGHTMRIVQTGLGLIATALAVAGCAIAPVQPGMSSSQVMDSYGKPTRVVATDRGTRLQYSQQPAGQSAVMVDLDTTGKVIAVREVMTPQEFLKIEPGKWTREDVEREFGPPAWVDRVASWPGDIMNYRWRDSLQDMYFWVYLDASQLVRRTGQGMEIPMRMNDN